MPTSYIQQIFLLIKRISLSFVLYQISRVLFFIFNRTHFPNAGAADVVSDCFYGLRFDAFSVVVSNSLFILLSLLPVKAFHRRWYQRVLFWLFMLSNTVFIATNFIDIGYFDFIRKRSSADLFIQIGGQSDIVTLLPRFFADFWFILLLFILTMFGIATLYMRVRTVQATEIKRTLKGNLTVIMITLVCIGISVLAVRGGLQRVPIDIVNAGSVTSAEEVPIVLNTPFTLIKSLNQKALQEYDFYSQEEVKKLYDPLHHFEGKSMNKMNVVVLILESFSKEYTRLGRNLGWTPFLDSLMDHSLVFTNAFSNGTKSIEGIPAILSSLPTLMDNPYINSLYANNEQTSFASVLKKEGYESSFFHGGINGTMNFDDWSALAGYDHYYGMNEYMNGEDFDGYWGIWDEPFMQYSIKKMNEMKEPFHTAVFTLSSHHPYFVPAKYKGIFRKGELENSESIQYADLSLRKFFETAAKTKWYNNTMFVLVADHCGISGHPFYANILGNLTIPVLFYKPDNSMKAVNNRVFTQIDILPTTLSILGYSQPFFSFGSEHGSVNDRLGYYYVPGMHFAFNDSMFYYYIGANLHHANKYTADSTLSTNIAGKQPALDSLVTQKFRAFLQTYNGTLLHNKGTFEKAAQ